MGWFSRKPRSRFPADMANRLEMLGRFEFDTISSGVDSTEIWPYCLQPFSQEAQDDPAGLVTDLLEFIRGDDSGFVTYGASCLVLELLPEKTWQNSEDALALLDAGIEVKRVRNLPSASLKGYEWGRWLEVHGPGTWPHGRPHPPV